MLHRSKDAVLKVAKGDRSGLAREARAIAAIASPCVVGLREVRGDPPRALVLDLVAGPTLAERVARRRLGAAELERLARRLARVQGDVASAGYVHGDFKPENFVLDGGSLDRVMVIDLETAVRVGEAYGPRVTTAYAAPERLLGSPAADPRADVFSVGAVLLAAATGRSPFFAETRDASTLAALALEPPTLAGIAPWLARAIAAMVQKSPELRPASVAAALTAEQAPADEADDLVGVASIDLDEELRAGERIVVPPGAIESVARAAERRGTLLLYASAGDEPYSSISPHLRRWLDLAETATFAQLVSAAKRARLGRRTAIHVAEVLGIEPDGSARDELATIRADRELSQLVRSRAVLDLLERVAKGKRVLAVAADLDRASKHVVRTIASGEQVAVIAEEGALDLPGARPLDLPRAAPQSLREGQRDELLAEVALLPGWFDADDVAYVANARDAHAPRVSASSVARALARWVASGELRSDAFGARFRFADASRQSALASSLEASRRRALLSRIAGWAASRHPNEHGPVARAFADAGEPLRAAYYAWRGAARALESSDLEAAAALLRLADEELVKSTGPVRRLLGGLLDVTRAQLLRWQGKHVDASLASRRALSIVPTGTAAWCDAIGERATAAGKLGDLSELLAVAAALRVAPAQDARIAWDRACARSAVQLFYAGKRREARALVALFRARTVRADGTADEQRRSLSPGALVTQALYDGRLDVHTELLERSRRAFLAIGDERSAVLYRSAAGFALAQLGDYASAERTLRKAEAEAARSPYPTLAALVAHNLGEVLGRRGDPRAGIELESRAIDALRVQKDVRFLAGSLAYRARMRLTVGDVGGAEADAREAVALGGTIEGLVPLLFGTLAAVELETGHADRALAAADRACAALGEGVEAGEALARLGRARSLVALGRRREGVVAARAAACSVRARAKKIASPRLRRSFLDRVAEHRALADLASTRVKDGE